MSAAIDAFGISCPDGGKFFVCEDSKVQFLGHSNKIKFVDQLKFVGQVKRSVKCSDQLKFSDHIKSSDQLKCLNQHTRLNQLKRSVKPSIQLQFSSHIQWFDQLRSVDHVCCFGHFSHSFGCGYDGDHGDHGGELILDRGSGDPKR
ncbi:hypothetical protein Daus18300_014112 [Diaporthe australafricana]|uniref:Uncharacterized protein n=1 Tax=Diaporthe australafricana TaxID=127596 RepID=A0ABR3VWH7_9PEZI